MSEEGEPSPGTADAFVRLVRIMAVLRHPERGCGWDQVQTFATIAPYTIEEAHEVADAIARDALDELPGELGDLLLQVVFHARIAEELGLFTIADVATAICDKMQRRHPHIFGGALASPGWEALKAAERADASDDPSALAGVALGLPALSRAAKLQARAAHVGFDWPDASGPRDKVAEELAETDMAVDADAREDELGDLLFAVVNWSRHLGVDPEAALRRASAKFERRFRQMEALAPNFVDLPLAAKDALWERAKRDERP